MNKNINYKKMVSSFVDDNVNNLTKKEVEYLYNLKNLPNEDIKDFIVKGDASILDGVWYSLSDTNVSDLCWQMHRYYLNNK